MSETPAQRAVRVRIWSNDRQQCRHCGHLRINVVHELDPAGAPEGFAYYQTLRDKLHEFIPSGEYWTDPVL